MTKLFSVRLGFFFHIVGVVIGVPSHTRLFMDYHLPDSVPSLNMLHMITQVAIPRRSGRSSPPSLVWLISITVSVKVSVHTNSMPLVLT